MDRKQAEELFLSRFPGKLAEARRTKEGYPYLLEEFDGEPGTWGEANYTEPRLRLRRGAKPWELPHEEEHLRQFIYGGAGPQMDEGYDAARLSRLYTTYGLTPDEATDLAYMGKPTEVAARKAAGDPSTIYQELLARVEALKAKRSKLQPTLTGRR